ncbi:LAMI_0A03114g1_1 [Lachancea mirantina]|uniref:LAMI_0A03114g1_1 n=1 Tax=Lachancea mirantina TaxID=1230905 RepID=A0A1G4IN22_9SACH|nr:LAMI_0A03114g1_1 [Lachancea mirantina]
MARALAALADATRPRRGREAWPENFSESRARRQAAVYGRTPQHQQQGYFFRGPVCDDDKRDRRRRPRVLRKRAKLRRCLLRACLKLPRQGHPDPAVTSAGVPFWGAGSYPAWDVGGDLAYVRAGDVTVHGGVSAPRDVRTLPPRVSPVPEIALPCGRRVYM